MLCKSCENEIPENRTVCAFCGTEAVDVPKNKQSKKRSKRKNKHNVTYAKDKRKQAELKKEQKEESNIPEVSAVQTETEMRENLFDGTEIVGKDEQLPQADNSRTLPESSGIMYEVAEELYRRERTASEIEALCRPPFKKVFDEKRLEELNRQATERTRTLVSSAADSGKKELTTGKAFLIQLLLFIPIVNMIAAIFLSFGKGTNLNIRAYARAFMIWCMILMTAALIYLLIHSELM